MLRPVATRQMLAYRFIWALSFASIPIGVGLSWCWWRLDGSWAAIVLPLLVPVTMFKLIGLVKRYRLDEPPVVDG